MDIITGDVYVSVNTEFAEVKIVRIEGRGVWFVPKLIEGWAEIPTWESRDYFLLHYRHKTPVYLVRPRPVPKMGFIKALARLIKR